jgi:hypothetical protein
VGFFYKNMLPRASPGSVVFLEQNTKDLLQVKKLLSATMAKKKKDAWRLILN